MLDITPNISYRHYFLIHYISLKYKLYRYTLNNNFWPNLSMCRFTNIQALL